MVAVDVDGAVNRERELAICAVAPPPENRTPPFLGTHDDDVNRPFVCSICGRGLASSRAMGGHKAHRTMSEKKRGLVVAEVGGGSDGGAVVNELPPQQPRRRPRYWGARRRCERCGRTFVNGQELGGHKLHCKGGPPPDDAPVEINGGGGDGRVIHGFDLNELPPPEPEEELLALPWYGNGAPAEL